MVLRGDIYNPARASQLVSFSGILYGKITPTDIDGLIDFGGNSFAILEFKFGDTPLPFGQRLAIENLVYRLQNGGASAIAIVCEHEIPAHQAIIASDTIVRSYLYRGKWQIPRATYTCKGLLDAFIHRATEFDAISTDIRKLMLFT